MFSFLGPKGILVRKRNRANGGNKVVLLSEILPKFQVRGLLNKEEIFMAKTTDYLAATHVVVATPDALVQVYTGDDRK